MTTPRLHPRSGSESGASFVLIAIMILVAFGIAALVVDGTHGWDVRGTCQSTADAAALAAGAQLPNQAAALAAALSYGVHNMDPTIHGIAVAPGDVIFGRWDFATKTFTPTTVEVDVNAVRVIARRSDSNSNPVETTFGKALGFDTLDVQSKATAACAAETPWFLALVQDVTGSFVAELSLAKTADSNLLDCFKSVAPGQSRLGVITFTGWSQMQAPLTPMLSGYPLLNLAISSIKSCGSVGAPICSGTDIAAGLQAGTNMLTGAPPLAGVNKAIVLVTDGSPEPNPSGSHPGATVAELKQYATEWANNADAAGISVFVVFYDETGNPTAGNFLQTLVRGEGIYLSTPDPLQIPALLDKICAQFSELTLVE